LRDLKIRGGKGQSTANKVLAVLGGLSLDVGSPLEGLKVTNHGETRIKHCVKYDLGDGYRLITIQNDKCIAVCFVGDHDDGDKWLDRNKGLTLVKNGEGQFTSVRKTDKISDPSKRISGESDGMEKKLIERLSKRNLDELLNGLQASVVVQLSKLDNISTEEQIFAICELIQDTTKAGLVYDIMVFLKQGDLEQAKIRIDLYKGTATELEMLSKSEFIDVKDGDTFRRINLESEDYFNWIKGFVDSSTYQEWMLFMHPAQQKWLMQILTVLQNYRV